MFEELNARLALAKEKRAKQALWLERVNLLRKELETEERQASVWEEQLAKEERDVARLSGLSFTALLYSLLQKKEDMLEVEEREVLEAKLKHEEAVRAAEELQGEIAEFEAKLQETKYWELEIQEILKEKKRLIQQSGSDKSIRLDELEEREADLILQVKELAEALREGQSVSADLERADGLLQSAHSWGTYDMLGGGFLSTHIKHSRMDEAMDSIRRSQSSLRRFEHELKDIRMSISIHMDIGDFLKFSDYFFDGLIADWLVQGRIKETLAQVESKLAEVMSILRELENAKLRAEAELSETRRLHDSLIESA